MARQEWKPDILGRGYEQLTLPLDRDAEGDVVATLVRHRGLPFEPLRRGAAAGCDVLYVHGWSDYFFQKPLAEYWHAQDARFYALDLRKYGRSLREGQTPGYITDLDDYDADIEAALTEMGHSRHDPIGQRPLILMGHSTGGLTLSLWAARHPSRVAALVLNSPWLEFQGSAFGREAIAPLERARARIDPRGPHPKVDLGFYTRSVARQFGGEWDYDEAWRPERGFATHPGWLAAVFTGQARVAAGLGLRMPVLTLLSSRSTLSYRWSETMRSTDGVLVVDDIARSALKLGDTVTVRRVEGALHDVVLSKPAVRAEAFGAITAWLSGYVPRG